MSKLYPGEKVGICPFFIILSLVFIPFISFSQIQGTIHDRNNQPLSFANILLINQKDSSVVAGIMSSDVGTFSIQSCWIKLTL